MIALTLYFFVYRVARWDPSQVESAEGADSAPLDIIISNGIH